MNELEQKLRAHKSKWWENNALCSSSILKANRLVISVKWFLLLMRPPLTKTVPQFQQGVRNSEVPPSS